MSTVSAPRRNLRTKNGCLTCRSRKVKCGEQRPVCYNCQRLHRNCIYQPSSSDQPTKSFQHETIGSDASNIARVENAVFSLDCSNAFPSGGILVDDFDQLNWLTGEWGDILEHELGPESVQIAAPTQSINDLSFNLDTIQIPFITPFDTSNWTSFCKLASHLAASQPTVASCCSAVEQMSRVLNAGQDTADALPQYFAARSAFVMLLKDLTLDLETILIATFLLCCTEVLAQQETVPVTLKQKDMLVTHVEQGVSQAKSPVVRRIIAWLFIFHAKAVHFGGRGLLSPRLIELLSDEYHNVPCLDYLNPSSEQQSAVVSSVHQDLFHFYYELQHISIRASVLNRHHRSRGTIADEADVAQISADIEKRLGYLWQSRPSILKVHSEDLDDLKFPEINHLSRLCILCYHAERVYHGRACGKDPLLSPDTIAARQAIRTMLTNVDPERVTHAALMWPLFQYIIESETQAEADWAMKVMEHINAPLWHADFFKGFVKALSAEQMNQRQRVDSRYFCIKYSGTSPPFM